MVTVLLSRRPIGRMSHGLRVVVTATRSHGRRREVVNSVRPSFLFFNKQRTAGFIPAVHKQKQGQISCNPPQTACGLAPHGEIEAIKVHHFIPGRDEVVDELLLRVGTSIDFGQARSWAFEPKTRSTRVPVHFTSPVLQSRPSNTSASFRRPASTPCSCRAGSRRSRWSALRIAW